MYYVLFGLFYLVSLLPLRVLYLVSDLAYFLLYRVAGYRKGVVMQNLTTAFPDKSEAEKEQIARKFYRNFTDTFIETIKYISASKRYLRKHFDADVSLLHELHQGDKSIQVHLGHNFNWELLNLVLPLQLPYKFLAVYLPINNKAFNRLFKYIRSRSGTHLISAWYMRREMLPFRNSQYIIGLIADQSPAHADTAYWVEFFGRPTAFIKGPERWARQYNYPVVFLHFTKKKRGYYKAHFELATREPSLLPEGEVTRMYAAFLERTMSQHPEMWLWSHRRWKHAWKPEYSPVIS